MCFTVQLDKDAKSVQNRFKVKADVVERNKKVVGFTYPLSPVVTNLHPEIVELMHWGLIPPWAKDKNIREYTLNAKIESLDEKPSFKSCLNNRCWIIVDGFYEWQWLDTKGKKKQQYAISLPDHELFAIAGLWSQWEDTSNGEIIFSYTMVTTEANELMAKIHNTKKRMPLILTPENEKAWLEGADYQFFSHPKVDLMATPTFPEGYNNSVLPL